MTSTPGIVLVTGGSRRPAKNTVQRRARHDSDAIATRLSISKI